MTTSAYVVDANVAVGQRNRLDPVGPVGGQVVGGHQAAGGLGVGGDRLSQVAVVERFAPGFRDPA